MRDSYLLKKLNSDPESGIALLIREYGGLVYSVVKGRLGSGEFCSEDVENCVSDVFSEFYMALPSYSPEKGSISAYLCVIARHNAADMLRQRYKDSLHSPLDEYADTLPDVFLTDEAVENEESRQALAQTIAALGKPDSEIIFRKYYLGQSSKDIAGTLGLTVSNVDTRTHRAIGRLRKILGGIKE